MYGDIIDSLKRFTSDISKHKLEDNLLAQLVDPTSYLISSCLIPTRWWSPTKTIYMFFILNLLVAVMIIFISREMLSN